MYLSKNSDYEDLDDLCANLKYKIDKINKDLKENSDFQIGVVARIIACLYNFNREINNIHDDFDCRLPER